MLFLQFAVDAEQSLDAAFYFGSDAGFFQFVAELLFDFRKEFLSLLATAFDGFLELLIADGIEIAETQIFQFATNFAHAQAVSDGAVNF